ncbi:LacI family DNA-binding transcriptional regulator [Novosphingobium sp. RL4]|uniref:LacI family DNA-binding transcriptional regulator n=1 Tax=Novosphingobium sp. RL4 TaxID=3109595 RepID=UPI002D7816C5|nr:LacI family DNA-binding transcriptional regulator [Novosphingobium sp. RL4]WRT94280.1 LacI family DNA-binding transcriptional regulator [Novosphingobium sp. RL4]
MKKVTLDDVAQRCGVTAKTVSRVVNREPHVSARVREAVEQAIAELGYRPNTAARSLASTRSFIIGMLSPRMKSAYLNRLHGEVLSACGQRGYHLIVEQLDLTAELYMPQLQAFLSQMSLDGLVLAPGLGDVPELNTLIAEAGVRSVAISPRTTAHPLIVDADEEQGERDLADHLWSLGHRSFAIAQPPAFWRFTRGVAFAQRLIKLGAEPGQIMQFPFDWTVPGLEGGRRMAIDILGTGQRPTALFAASDELAAGAIGLFLTRGVNVPGGISVAGFDDDDIAQACWPALTTVRQPLEAMVENAMDLLIGDGRAQPMANIRCSVEIVSRASTAARQPFIRSVGRAI